MRIGFIESFKTIFSVLFFGTFMLPGYGQCIKGSLRDSLSGEPLSLVTISIPQLGRRTISDDHGLFILKNIPKGAYRVNFSLVGYRQKKLLLRTVAEEDATRPSVPLIQASEKLNEVTIAGRKINDPELKKLQRQAYPVTIIDGQQIEARASSLNELLDRQAGVKIRQNGGLGNAATVNIRGLEGKRVQIYLDGNPLNTPDGSFNMNDLPTQFIRRIEIYKGIVPPELGGDGLGGAINIVTIHPETDYVDAGYSVGSFNTHTGTFVYKHIFPRSGIEVGVGGGLNYAENNYRMRSPYPPFQTIQRNNDHYLNAYGAMALTFTKTWFDEAKIEVLRYYNDKGFQGIKSNIRYAHAVSNLYIINPELVKTNFLLPGLDFKMNTFLLRSVSATIDTSHNLYDFSNNAYPNSGQGEIGYIPNQSHDKLNELRNRLNLKYRLGRNWSVNLNNDLRYSRRKPFDPVAEEFILRNINPLAANISRQNASLLTAVTSAATESRYLDGRLGNITSLRHYYMNSSGSYVNLFFGSIFTPEPITYQSHHLGANTAFDVALTKTLLWKLAVEQNYRLPQTQEVYGDGILTTANPQLRPERSANISTGILYYHYGNNRRVQIEISAFNMNLRDMIQLGGNGTTFGYQNLGKVRILGIEGEAKVDLDANWFISGNITYQDLKDRLRYVSSTAQANPTYGLRVPNVPYFFFNHAVEYRKADPFRTKGQSLRAYLESSYTSRYYYGYKLSALQDLDIPANYVHTLGVECRFRSGGLTVGAEMQNLTNARVINNFNNPLPGRSFRIKIRYMRAGKAKSKNQ